MRVLCTVTGSPSHGRAMLPMARALVRAGHEVAVVTSEYVAETFAGEPMRVHPVFPTMAQVLRGMRAGLSEVLTQDLTPYLETVHFVGGPHVTAAFHAIMPVARACAPDLVLRDGADLAGCLIAEALDVPHLSAPSGATNILDPEGVLPLLSARRAEVGLPAQDAMAIFRYGRLDAMPPQYSCARYEIPLPYAYRQPLWEYDGSMPEIPTDKPLVLATLGTALPMFAEIRRQGLPDDEHTPRMREPLRAIIEGLSRVDCHAVVATGGTPVDDVPVGANVHLVDWIPQRRALQRSHLLVTHCGYNSVREAFSAGVPMVAVPQFADQAHHAALIEGFGLGRRAEQTADGVAGACQRVLADETIRERMRSAHGATLALPDEDGIVAQLENLVTP